MRGLTTRLLPVAAALLVASGCSNNDTTTTTTPATTLTTIETFSGTLNANGAFSYPFVVLAAGTISAQLNTLTPDSAQPIGIALGTWNGNACQIVLSNDSAVQSSSVLGQSTVAGNFCVRIYDAGGKVSAQETYVVQVTHP